MEVENSEKFRILVVDDDINCLLTTTASLKNLKFEVMTVNNIEVALGGLRSSGLSFDLLLTDVHMLKMDVFQFQQEIAKEFDIPVAFMSNDEKDNTLMKGLDNRAVFFIVKPITQDNINYLWEYAISLRKKKHTSKQEFEENPNEVIYIESSSSVSERDKSTRKYDDVENEDGSSQSSKTSRIIWTDSLHNKFLEAIAILGVKKAYPKKILELMNIPELSRKHIASHLQKYRMRLEKNAIPELILNSSKITPSNANQLSTTTDNISTLAPQLMTENLNYSDHDTETDLRGFMSDYEKDREFSNILSGHLNQKPCNLQGNHEGINAAEIPFHLGNVLPNSASEQGKYASITAEERPFHFSNVSPNLALEQEIYGGVTAEEALFEHLYVPSNSEIGPGDYGSLTVEECLFFDSIILNHELEQANHEGLTTKEGLLQLRNDPPNTTLEQADFISFIAEEDSFLHNIVPNHELQQQNYGSVTTQDDSFLLCYDHPDLEPKKEQDKSINTEEEIPVHLCNAPSNKASEQESYGGVTTKDNSFQLCHDLPNLKFEKEQDKSINTEEEIPVHLRNAPSNKASEKERGKSINTAEEGPLHLHNVLSNKESKQDYVNNLWISNYFPSPANGYQKK